ncbi:hypothetical protein [Pseudomonas sp. 25 R 14]|nr:hypothetical protein [Pseudomonas sp. 25 R 14]
MAQAAFRLQRLYQLLERQVLVGLGLQRRVLDLSQQFDERTLAIHLGLEHLGIDEEANQTLDIDPLPVGHWHADTNVALPAIAM